ncbi:hypothetical protein [Geminocystis herdmanii]|nr:hypothetical protein [Geminocystis herdmanii]
MNGINRNLNIKKRGAILWSESSIDFLGWSSIFMGEVRSNL